MGESIGMREKLPSKGRKKRVNRHTFREEMGIIQFAVHLQAKRNQIATQRLKYNTTSPYIKTRTGKNRR